MKRTTQSGVFVLSTGREIAANRWILGVEDDGSISEGYDGHVFVNSPHAEYEPFTDIERWEIADYMIGRWTDWKYGMPPRKE